MNLFEFMITDREERVVLQAERASDKIKISIFKCLEGKKGGDKEILHPSRRRQIS